MRGANGDSRAVNNALETISAAATAIASAENRIPQASVQVIILPWLINLFSFTNKVCVFFGLIEVVCDSNAIFLKQYMYNFEVGDMRSVSFCLLAWLTLCFFFP